MSSAHHPLTRENLLPTGPLRRVGTTVYTFETIESTNEFLRTYAGELPDGALAVAEYQTAGRGRQGRRWVAPRGAAVMLSVLLHERAGSRLLAGAALLGAVAACRAVEQTSDCRPAVRWPNDVTIGGRKLGGVLAEASMLAGGPHGSPRAVVLGIGLNCLQQRGHFDGELVGRATSLEIESALPVERAAVGAALLRALDELLARAAGSARDWAGVVSEWRERCDDFGRRVELQQDGLVHSGTVLDISDEGDLIVQLDEGGRRCFDAETTTRPW